MSTETIPAQNVVLAKAASSSRPMSRNGRKRSLPAVFYDEKALPMGDQNAWYVPVPGLGQIRGLSAMTEDEEEDLPVGTRFGNWGKKNMKGSRWVRRGKIASWGPGIEEWEAEDRARKRLKRLQSPQPRSPSPPSLPHLRSPSPPQMSPFPQPTPRHYDYTSFVMDKSVTHSFRSNQLLEAEKVTTELIEGETTLRLALGKLWQVINDFGGMQGLGGPSTNGILTNGLKNDIIKPKNEEEEEEDQDEREMRLKRAPDLTPGSNRAFLDMPSNIYGATYDPAHQFEGQEAQFELLEKSLGMLRELQDDEREYCERLDEIREVIGDVRAQRDLIWDAVREQAISELKSAASFAVS